MRCGFQESILIVAGYVALPRGGWQNLRRVMKQGAVIATLGVIAWALLSIYFAATGRFQIFRDLIVSTSLDYAAG